MSVEVFPFSFQELGVIIYYSTCVPLEGVLSIELPFLEPLFLTTPFFIFFFYLLGPFFLFICLFEHGTWGNWALLQGGMAHAYNITFGCFNLEHFSSFDFI
jgi:hypothetical protein